MTIKFRVNAKSDVVLLNLNAVYRARNGSLRIPARAVGEALAMVRLQASRGRDRANSRVAST